MLESLCYICHNKAMDLNYIIKGYVDDDTGRPVLPAIYGENTFLLRVITPSYQTIKKEVDASRNDTAPHAAWQKYDDINEYFWNGRCFEQLRWPLDLSRNFFLAPPNKNRVWRTSFVEQRSFWNLFRSFDNLWIMLILFLQAATILTAIPSPDVCPSTREWWLNKYFIFICPGKGICPMLKFITLWRFAYPILKTK